MFPILILISIMFLATYLFYNWTKSTKWFTVCGVTGFCTLVLFVLSLIFLSSSANVAISEKEKYEILTLKIDYYADNLYELGKLEKEVQSYNNKILTWQKRNQNWLLESVITDKVDDLPLIEWSYGE